MSSSNADAAIVQRDPSLPGLAILLDDERLTECLHRSPQGAGIVRAEVDYLRYKPATSCIAGLRLYDHQGKVQHAFAKALPVGSRDWAWQRRRLARRNLEDGCFSTHMVEEAGLLMAAPEHDRRLTALSQLLLKSRQRLGPRSDTSAQHGIPALPLLLSTPLRALAEHLPEPAWLDCQILRYKPERRLVARLSHKDRIVGLLRACANPDYGQTLAGARLAEALGGATLLASDPTHDCLVGSWIAGESLHPHQASELPDARTFQAIGQLLKKLHQAQVSHPIIRQRQNDIDAIRQATGSLGLLQPSLSEAARALQQRVGDALRHADWTSCLNHGDFSLEQVIRTPSGDLQMIDWDAASMGDPAADIGSMLARLCMQHLEGTLPEAAPAMALENLLDGYQTLPSTQFVQLIHWHTVAGLIRLMPEGFRKRKPGWAETIGRALQYAIDMADRIDATRAPRGTPQPSNQGELWPLNDSLQMHGPIANALSLPVDGFRLAPVRVLRHKAGRRALLEYVIEVPGQAPTTLIGKWRHKGVDQNGYSIQQAFWQQGFDLPELSVPEAVAIMPEYRLWLQRKCAGEMYTLQLNPDSPTNPAARIGRAIASLHNSRVPTKRQWTLDDELKMLHERLRMAIRLRPIWAERIEALIPATQRLADRLPANPPTGIHRDCYPDQILVDGERLLWLDLDLYCEGDPALDIGNFIAHMIEHALRHYNDPLALEPQQQALQQAFGAHSNTPVSDTSIAAWTTLALTRHIYLSTQFPDRHHTTAALLELCETRLHTPPDT
ncbi:MAG: phosphotransferase [Lautropia sp.]|nr:phosphotransferase [Lautropia sp.]